MDESVVGFEGRVRAIRARIDDIGVEIEELIAQSPEARSHTDALDALAIHMVGAIELIDRVTPVTPPRSAAFSEATPEERRRAFRSLPGGANNP
ncbi:MAG: hypothetical protein JOZ19_15410 [Rubrobacter sp.]|nr:hypothetical protein [Rubrobacter sp.]